jgi:hypothetical protein
LTLPLVDDDQGAEAVILDLMYPASPRWRRRDRGRDFELDKATAPRPTTTASPGLLAREQDGELVFAGPAIIKPLPHSRAEWGREVRDGVDREAGFEGELWRRA